MDAIKSYHDAHLIFSVGCFVLEPLILGLYLITWFFEVCQDLHISHVDKTICILNI